MHRETIKLVKDGIFPITKDSNGTPLQEVPDTGFTNIGGTAQGEGRLIGTTGLFIRVSGCNLRCSWSLPNGKISICDTPYSSHNTNESDTVNLMTVVDTVVHNIGNMQHVVLTGGEPTLQAAQLSLIAKELKRRIKGLHITLETNGTKFSPELAKYVDLFSISPKLSKSKNYIPCDGDSIDSRSAFETTHIVQKYLDMCYTRNIFGKKIRSRKHDIQLKFVVTDEQDEAEIRTIVRKLNGISKRDIYIMPVGSDEKTLKKTSMSAIQVALKNGWQFTPRLHILLFGSKKGV